MCVNMCAHKREGKQWQKEGNTILVHGYISAEQPQITKWTENKSYKLGTALAEGDTEFFETLQDSKETLHDNVMTVVIFQVTYYKKVFCTPMKSLRLPLHSEKKGWNSSLASGGTQPFAPQTLTWTSARNCLLWNLGGDFWKANPLFLQNASSITLRFYREKAYSSSNCAHWTCHAFQGPNRNLCTAIQLPKCFFIVDVFTQNSNNIALCVWDVSFSSNAQE